MPQIGVSKSTCMPSTYDYWTTTWGGALNTESSTVGWGMEPSTSHTGAMVIGMADGSVRTISSGISQTTWYYACQPTDHRPLGSDW